MPQYRDKVTKQLVDVSRPKEGTLIDGVRTELGDWLVDGAIVKPQDFVDRYEIVEE